LQRADSTLNLRSMPAPAAPNERLACLVDVLGEAETRELVALFLQSFPAQMNELANADRERGRRAAHGLKSASQQMGVADLAARMADLEARLSAPGQSVARADIEAAEAAFKAAEGALRKFAAGG
jgi:HPt (histidine-containing phosphotransfer) domain-containing protein